MTIFDSTTDKCENCGHPQKAHDYEAHSLGACAAPAPQTEVMARAIADEARTRAADIMDLTPLSDRWKMAVSPIIASAIMAATEAERERCAKLMEDDSQWTFAGNAVAAAIFEDARELAAAAIRAGTEGSADA